MQVGRGVAMSVVEDLGIYKLSTVSPFLLLSRRRAMARPGPGLLSASSSLL